MRRLAVWRGYECDIGFAPKVTINAGVDDDTVDPGQRAVHRHAALRRLDVLVVSPG
jgi:hypothetical protein